MIGGIIAMIIIIIIAVLVIQTTQNYDAYRIKWFKSGSLKFNANSYSDTDNEKEYTGITDYGNLFKVPQNWISTSTNIEEVEESNTDEHQKVNRDIYYLTDKGSKVQIEYSVVVDASEETYYCIAERTPFVSLIRDSDFIFLYSTINWQGTVIKIFASHTLPFLDENIKENAAQLNPQIYTIPKVKRSIPIKHITKQGKAIIYTKEVMTMKDYIIETKVTTNVNVMCLMKPKPKVGTVAIVLTLPNEKDMYWSGSIVKYEKQIYIVGIVTIFPETSVIKLVAYALATYTIQIVVGPDE